MSIEITVSPRPTQSKGARRRRRMEGYVPGSIYGRGLEAISVEVPAKAIAEVLTAESGLNSLIAVTVKGTPGKHNVVVDNLERDPVTRSFQSIGLHRVNKGDRVHAHIPVTLHGVPTDVQLNGALLEQTLESVEVSAEPANLPPHIDADVSGLKIGDVLRVKDLVVAKEVTIATPEDTPVAAVHVSSTARQLEEADAASTGAEEPVSGPNAVTELRADKDKASDSITGAEGQP